MGRYRETIPDLAAIRKGRGLSLEQIAESTKISPFYLLAIEDGQIQKLPGGIYAKSYIRQYARAIDYNEHELLEKCDLASDEEDPIEQPSPSAGHLSPLARFMTAMLHFHGAESDAKRTG
jgi:cytoskeletal protein RodZ